MCYFAFNAVPSSGYASYMALHLLIFPIDIPFHKGTMPQSTLSLAHLGDNLDAWSRSPLHPTLLPIGFLALVHAIRVSHATRQVAGSHRNKLGTWQSFLLNQILMFGGVVVSGMLLGIPSPLFRGSSVVVLYGGVHLVLHVAGLGNLLLKVQDHVFLGTL